ncbi:hypothetical protein ACDH70_21330 [Xanthomonas axonopodis pv. poinsettiicola]|uniref:hypothetical protein n=1 Tax=Xanthomonas TaxID=338 RepID=UPI001E4881B4|nr:hypothetical protein [Xanthomonas codiaei]MCC8537625.1 hypothetical protein [Xanthomonas codiaei]
MRKLIDDMCSVKFSLLGDFLKNSVLTFVLAFSLVACSQQPATSQERIDFSKSSLGKNDASRVVNTRISENNSFALNSTEIDSIVRDVMNSAYGAGNFDQARRCWKYEFNASGEPLDYCMVGLVSKVSNDGEGVKLYIQAHSDPQAAIYSQVDPGLQGLFVVGVDAGKKAKTLAAKPAMDMGQAGDCGCLDAKVIQVGPARYGWLSTTGGIWQGVQVTRYSLYVPIGMEIRDVSGIPRVAEKSPSEINEFRVMTGGDVVAGMYPLEITRKRGDTVVETRLVPYDETKRTYPWNP